MIITLLSAKGGVGKSTSAVHIATYLHSIAPTLLVDGDGIRRAEPMDTGGAHRGGGGGWGRGLVRHLRCSLVGWWSLGVGAGLPSSGRDKQLGAVFVHPDREQARGLGRARVLGKAVQRPRRLHPALPGTVIHSRAVAELRANGAGEHIGKDKAGVPVGWREPAECDPR